MKIAILGDVHSRHDHIKLCIDSIQSKQCECIVHLGDYGGPKHSLKPIFDMGLPISGIRGNTDGEKWGIMKLYESRVDCEIARVTYGTFEIGGKKFFLSHFPDITTYVVKSGEFDVVAYGHTHVRHQEVVGKTLVINPGSIIGDEQSPSYAIYDTDTHNVEFIELG